MDLNAILKIINTIKDSDLKIKISALVDENLALKNENFELKKKFDRMSEMKKLESELIFKDNLYYRKKEDGAEDGPFCSKCWDDEKKMIRMVRKGGTNQHFYNECPKCKNLIYERK